MCNTICIWAKCINMFFILSPPGYPTGIFFASIHFYLSISDAFHKYKGSPQHTYARTALFIIYIYVFPSWWFDMNIVYIEQHLPKIHHIDPNKKVAVLQKTLSKSFRKWKLFLFWITLHCNMFSWVQLNKNPHCFGQWLGAAQEQAILWTKDGLVYYVYMHHSAAKSEVKSISLVGVSVRDNTDICHYCDVIMSQVASHITNLTIVYWTVYSGVDQRTHQSFA